MDEAMPTNVAIACQGGGSHTAFAAGVLEKALRWIEDGDARLVGISGTSGGAVSAVAAWTGYLAGGADAAVANLEGVWADIAVSTPVERAVNDWVDAGLLPEDRFKRVEIRKLILERECSPSTKFRRTEGFIEEVLAEGRETAAAMLEDVEADLADGGSA